MNGGSDQRSVWGIHSPGIFTIQRGAVRSYLEFPNYIVLVGPTYILIIFLAFFLTFYVVSPGRKVDDLRDCGWIANAHNSASEGEIRNRNLSSEL